MGQKDGEKWTAAVDSQPTLPKSDRLLESVPCGSVAEWSIAPVLKTGGPQGPVSSNLTASARTAHQAVFLRLNPPTIGILPVKSGPWRFTASRPTASRDGGTEGVDLRLGNHSEARESTDRNRSEAPGGAGPAPRGHRGGFAPERERHRGHVLGAASSGASRSATSPGTSPRNCPWRQHVWRLRWLRSASRGEVRQWPGTV